MLYVAIVRNLFTDPTVLAILVVTVVLGWPVGRWVASRFGCRRRVGVLFVGAVGGVVALTATSNPIGVPLPAGPGSLLAFAGEVVDVRTLRAELQTFCGNAAEVANVALFVPVGFLGTLVCRRALVSMAFGLTLTLAVESWQALIGRSSEVGDLLHNSAGAVIGALLAAIARRGAVALMSVTPKAVEH